MNQAFGPRAVRPIPRTIVQKQVRKEYIRNDIEKTLHTHEMAAFDEFCLTPLLLSANYAN